MNEEDFSNLIANIQEKIGEENSSLIADDLGTLITNNTKQLNEIDTRNKKIEKLTNDKENLIASNGNLLQQIAMQDKQNLNDDSFINYNKDEGKEQEPFSFKKQFDEKGNFIN